MTQGIPPDGARNEAKLVSGGMCETLGGRSRIGLL